MRLGQNFLADPNLLAAIVRDAGVGGDDVVLEVGGGEGVLTAALAPRVRAIHVVEMDQRLRDGLEALAGEHGNVELHIADALRLDLAALDPAPSTVVSNLPYAIATPLLIRTIEELPGVGSWTVMVQREIADRLRAAPGTPAYGAPSVIVQLACDVRMLRAVDRAVFTPRPRVDSALLRLDRRGPAAPAAVAALVHDAFAHRRKTLAGSVALARRDCEAGAEATTREAIRDALDGLDLPADARAERLAPAQFVRLAELLGEPGRHSPSALGEPPVG